MKEGIRILSVDDAPFAKSDSESLVVGIVARKEVVEGVISFYVTVDGNDATDKLISKIRQSRFLREIKLVALNSITLAGLNIVDIIKINSELNIPVLAITRKKPNQRAMEHAIERSGKDVEEKIRLLRKINKASLGSRSNGFYIQYIGIARKELSIFVNTAYQMLRLAHLVASGVVKGESKGRL